MSRSDFSKYLIFKLYSTLTMHVKSKSISTRCKAFQLRLFVVVCSCNITPASKRRHIVNDSQREIRAKFRVMLLLLLLLSFLFFCLFCVGDVVGGGGFVCFVLFVCLFFWRTPLNVSHKVFVLNCL